MSSSLETIRQIRGNAESFEFYQPSEADTVLNLIDPILDFLQFPPNQQRREEQRKLNRPDIVVWDSPDQMRHGDPAKLILEAKPLRADLSGNGKSKQERPKEQLARYVTGYERGGPSTLGILTDGNIWHVVQAIPDSHRIRFLQEIRLLDGSDEAAANELEKLQNLIRADNGIAKVREAFARDARQFTNAISDERGPTQLLSLLADVQDVSTDLKGRISLGGTAEYAERAHWDSYAFTLAGNIIVEQPSLFGNTFCVAVVRMKNAADENDRSLYRPDVATVAATFAKIEPIRMSVVVVIQPDEEGNSVNARLAVHHQGHTSMTIGFNPYAPPPHILKKLQSLYEILRSTHPVKPTKIANLVATSEVRKEYYKDITEKWVLRLYRRVQNENFDQGRQFREAILRHLMRMLFVWILKEEGKLPQEAFDPVFASRYASEGYHQNVLTFLFHKRLNIPLNQREPHPVSEIDEALQDTPFLNGSLFARHKYDDILTISLDDYFREDPDSPGLFTILSNYEWTVSEHTAAHSDQTVDPEILSNLFENLIAVTEMNETPNRMPKGTYYTPADVAKEMAKDALMLAIKRDAPPRYSGGDLRKLFDDDEAFVPSYSNVPEEKANLLRLIRNLTIFDPSVGSGVFLLSILSAIRAALTDLSEHDDSGSLTRKIISQQLYAQDINPMAVQITRLRLAIAIIAAERDCILPLPNLEARVVCADTLSTIPKRNWSPTATGRLQDENAAIVSALSKRAELFQKWQEAHQESKKEALRKSDERLREELNRTVQDDLAGDETIAFADFTLLDSEAPPVQTDPRLIFYRSDWQGFDVVIGNPPYERLAKDQEEQERKRMKGSLRRRGYTTVACNDLYSLIAEAALTLARPQGGVLSLIVPLSICFGQNKQSLRQLFEQNSSEMYIRSHDNRPDPIFKKSPVTHPESRQRTTIINAVMSRSQDKPIIQVTGVNKWPKSERFQFLTHRSYSPRAELVRDLDSKLDNQWERIPNTGIADLITAMRGCSFSLKSMGRDSTANESVGFPKSAYEFLTVVPPGRLKRREFTIDVGEQENQAVAVAAANSHIAYTWWKTYGDAFDVTYPVMSNLPIPHVWVEDPHLRSTVIALGRKLIAEIDDSNIEWRTSGTKKSRHQSLNFHNCAPDTIEEIDTLYLTSLGLPEEPLLTNLRKLRSNSNWYM